MHIISSIRVFVSMEVSFELLWRSLSSTFTGAYANLSRYARKKQKCRRVGVGGKDRGCMGFEGEEGGGSKGGIQGDRRRPKGVASFVSVCVLFSCVDDELVE